MGSSSSSAIKWIRVLVMLAVVLGGMWYFFRFQRQRKAVEANNAARLLIESKKFDEAMNLLEEARKLAPDNAEIRAAVEMHLAMAQAGKGAALAEAKEYEDALALLEGVRELSPKVAEDRNVAFYMAYCYANMDKTRAHTERAIELLQQALDEDPENPDAKLWMIKCERRMEGIPLRKKALNAFARKDYDAARAAFRKLAEKPALLMEAPTEPWYSLARIALIEGKGAEAVKWLKLSEENQGNQKELADRHKMLREEILRKFPDRADDLSGKTTQSLFE